MGSNCDYDIATFKSGKEPNSGEDSAVCGFKSLRSDVLLGRVEVVVQVVRQGNCPR